MNWEDYMLQTRRQLKALNKAIPGTTYAFGKLGEAVKEGDGLDFKTKEFIALGIAIAERCEPCIGFHIEALKNCDATREELAGALAMAVHMGGGPSMMYAAKALDAWDQL